MPNTFTKRKFSHIAANPPILSYSKSFICKFNVLRFSGKSIPSLCPKQILLLVLGDITQKGYEKKRQRLLAPYLSSSKTVSQTAQGKPIA